MADELHGKVIIVTGASGSVGRGTVKALAQAGACLALVDRDAGKMADIINTELGGDTDCYKGFPADLSSAEAVDTMLDHIVEQFTEVDGLVHTVGGFAMGDPVHGADISVFDKMMTLNARILFLVAGRVAKYMVDNERPGSITAVLARSGKAGIKTQAAYTASKAAATRIVESMALELRDYGIRVNGVSPSIVDTPPNRESMPNADFEKWVTPAQIGDLMVYLQSDKSTAITGANIEISGRS